MRPRDVHGAKDGVLICASIPSTARGQSDRNAHLLQWTLEGLGHNLRWQLCSIPGQGHWIIQALMAPRLSASARLASANAFGNRADIDAWTP